jgi:hypothetical protein
MFAPSVVAVHLTDIYGTLAVFETYARPNRYVLISRYADFFRRHPLFKPDCPHKTRTSMDVGDVHSRPSLLLAG